MDEKFAANRKKRLKKNGKLSKGQKIALSVVIIIYAVVIVMTSVVVLYRPRVENTPRKYVHTYTDSDGNVIESEYNFNVVDDKFNILVLGHDRMAMLTDVIMLVNVDNTTNEITVMQIPRDTWVSDNSDVYVISNKINAVFASYYNLHRANGTADDEAYKAALEDMADLIEDSLCIEINFSLIMDLNGFSNIVDILGGVDIEVPFDMVYNDPAQGLYINIPAGYQHLDGAAAEGFVRYRKGYLTADLGRQDAQKRFLIALFNKVKSSISISNVGMLTNLAGEISDNLVTDMSAADILFFAQSVLRINLEDIRMMMVPGNLASSYYVINKNATLDTINKYFNNFDKDISPSVFDHNGTFVNIYNYEINEAYNASEEYIYDNSVYEGDEIDNGGAINIPHY